MKSLIVAKFIFLSCKKSNYKSRSKTYYTYRGSYSGKLQSSAADKLYGTKGFLRRDNEVYKINLTNAFSGKDDKENFFLKKE